MALKKPFGALNNAYYGPTMVLKTIYYFSPKMSPKVRGRERPGPFTLVPRTIDQTIVRTSGEDGPLDGFWGPLGWFWGMERRSRFLIGPRRQYLRYCPRACHSWRSITRSEALSRSTLAVASPTGVIGWMTAPFSLKCSSHMSRRGSKNRTA